MAISNLSSRLAGPTLLRRFTLLSLGTTLAVGVLFGAITARLVEDFALRQQARAIAARVLELAGSRFVFQDFFRSHRPDPSLRGRCVNWSGRWTTSTPPCGTGGDRCSTVMPARGVKPRLLRPPC